MADRRWQFLSYACRLNLLPRVIAGSHKRTGFNVTESHFHSNLVKLAELRGRVIAIEGDVLVRRSQVLSERQNVDIYFAKVAHYCDYFLRRLAHAENHSGLRWNIRRDALRKSENLHHARITSARTRLLI